MHVLHVSADAEMARHLVVDDSSGVQAQRGSEGDRSLTEIDRQGGSTVGGRIGAVVRVRML